MERFVGEAIGNHVISTWIGSDLGKGLEHLNLCDHIECVETQLRQAT